MQWIALRALVHKDLLLFFSDRRAVIMGLVAPIAIASFFGSIFNGSGGSEPAKIRVAIVDEDTQAVSRAVLDGASGDKSLKVSTPSRAEARAAVRAGSVSVAVVIPQGFSDAATRAFFGGGSPPALTMWFDPSRAAEVGMVRGIMTQHVMEAVGKEMFGGASGRRVVEESLNSLDALNLPDDQKDALRALLKSVQQFYGNTQPGAGARAFAMPFTVSEEAVTSQTSVPYNGYAHSFAGMGAQFTLFSAIDLGIGVLLERQRGLWKRLRSAPLSRFWLLASRALSTAIIGFVTMLVAFAFAIVVFKVRVAGSVVGFVAIIAAYAVMVATFGLMIAALGKTPGGTRGVAILATLVMVMLGGAWVPAFVFPAWLQQLTLIIPVRWAIDGLDAVTWRGLGIGAALWPTVVLLGFSILFGWLALARFRWDEA